MTILAFYRRVFTMRITWFKYAIYAVFAYTTGWVISSFFAGLFQWYGDHPDPRFCELLLTNNA